MIFEIAEIDRDYNTCSDILQKEFDNLKEAEDWCKKETWTGHYYFVMNAHKYRNTK